MNELALQYQFVSGFVCLLRKGLFQERSPGQFAFGLGGKQVQWGGEHTVNARSRIAG